MANERPEGGISLLEKVKQQQQQKGVDENADGKSKASL